MFIGFVRRVCVAAPRLLPAPSRPPCLNGHGAWQHGGHPTLSRLEEGEKRKGGDVDTYAEAWTADGGNHAGAGPCRRVLPGLRGLKRGPGPANPALRAPLRGSGPLTPARQGRVRRRPQAARARRSPAPPARTPPGLTGPGPRFPGAAPGRTRRHGPQPPSRG